MGTNSRIEWTEATWNPTVGCDRISPGCAHCYAKTLHDRRHTAFIAGKDVAPQYAKPFEELQLIKGRLYLPLRWRKPRMVFVNSVSDLFHEDVPDAFIDRVFEVMSLARRHTFQVLTKRPDRMHQLVPTFAAKHTAQDGSGWPPPNVWLGVSVENQHFADERIPLLLATPAAVRFISAEPLLGPIDFGSAELRRNYYGHLDWVILGGESGPGARRFDLAWARLIVQQCQAAAVPCFVKQLGSNPHQRVMYGPATFEADQPVHVEPINLRDRKGGDPSEWPGDLKVREFPSAAVTT
jgi:protein gp37